MNNDMQTASQGKSAAPIGSVFAIIFVVIASLLGGSGGYMIANNVDLLGQFKSLIQQFMTPSSAIEANANKPPVKPDEASTKGKAAKVNATAPTPHSDLIGAVSCTHGQDSASVSIELGGATVLGTDRLKEPERIYFDLQDSQQREGSKERLLKTKTIPFNGPLVARIRCALWESGAARVVLDLTRACEYSYHISPETPSHLVVEVYPSGPGASALKK